MRTDYQSGTTARLAGADLGISYGRHQVFDDLNLSISAGEFVVIIGPNASGKSTLLKALARVVKPQTGTVYFSGRPLRDMANTAIARELSMLPQSHLVPPGVRVGDFVTRGRYAHQTMIRRWSKEDERAVQRAIDLTGISAILDRPLEELSGGQKQRVWMAVVLAQNTDTVLLDEPTTYLDVANQLELLELCVKLHRDGRTIIAVLHDLCQAARFATRLICIDEGTIVADGTATEVLTPELLRDVFRLEATIIEDPVYGTPHIIPHASIDKPKDA